MGVVVRTYVRDVVASVRDESLAASNSADAKFVCVGDVIDTENDDNYLRWGGLIQWQESMSCKCQAVVVLMQRLLCVAEAMAPTW